jgi:peptide methionine sulfoxide reductase msrA/msrB
MARRWEYVMSAVALGGLLLLLGVMRAGPEAVRPGAGAGAGVGAGASGKGAAAMNAGRDKVVRTDAEWRRLLTPEQYRIAREKATELPFSGKYFRSAEAGTYRCAACGQELFRSEAKFDSGCGWPSFSAPAGAASVEERTDASEGMVRTEVLCSRCGAHLGHVFDDGPGPSGLRYCINSGILEFAKARAAGRAAAEEPARTERATFAAGCFWGVEAAFRKLPGVLETAVGYTGGRTENPTYRQVCSDRTGHAEAVEVVFDPRKIGYEQLLDAFWRMHDPTQLNRQGPDVGSQYRSAVFCHSEEQKRAAEASRRRLEESGRLLRPVATAIEPAGVFWRAEEYHQRYVEKHGGAACHL